ncbi:MAG: radical SAM protein, partial [Gammaproteobacteria bacterium]|nr:radical SAM protein [Gammaproteobacteria bacterium]
CQYCDTEYAFHGGDAMSIDAVLAQVAAYDTPLVCVTGGEPLAQPNCLPLLSRLCDAGYDVSLETSGALDIAGVDERVNIVMDLKTPASGEVERNLWANIDCLKADDQIKFVICDRTDYEWSRDRVAEYDLAERFAVLFSPAWQQIEPRDLAAWILADRLKVRFQLQVHKYVWGEEPGH